MSQRGRLVLVTIVQQCALRISQQTIALVWPHSAGSLTVFTDRMCVSNMPTRCGLGRVLLSYNQNAISPISLSEDNSKGFLIWILLE